MNRTRASGNTSKSMILFLDYIMDDGKLFPVPPGLLPLIEILRKRKHRVDFITRKEELFGKLRSIKYDVVGISTFERKLTDTIKLATKIKEIDSQVVLILGGPSVEFFAPILLEGPIDMVIGGEAEHSLPLVLQYLERVSDYMVASQHESMTKKYSYRSPITRKVGLALSRATFRRTVHKKGLEVRLNVPLSNVFIKLDDDSQLHLTGARRLVERYEEMKSKWKMEHSIQFPINECEFNRYMDCRPLEEELDGLVKFPWDIIEYYGWKRMELYVQRGCKWGKCAFCALVAKDIRRMSVSAVLSNIQIAVEAGIKTVSFSDDMFFQNRKWVENLLDGIIDLGLEEKLDFMMQTRISTDIIELLPKMKQANFSRIHYGVETLNPKRVVFYQKALDGKKYVKETESVVKATAKEGISPFLYMILTDPKSRLIDIAHEIYLITDFLKKIYFATGILAIMSFNLVTMPLTGTLLNERCKYSETVIPIASRRDMDSNECRTINLVLPNEFMHLKETTNFLNEVFQKTRSIYNPMNNLQLLDVFIDCLMKKRRCVGKKEKKAITQFCNNSQINLQILKSRMDALLMERVSAIRELLYGDTKYNPETVMSLLDSERLLREFGGYYEGIEKYIYELEVFTNWERRK